MDLKTVNAFKRAFGVEKVGTGNIKAIAKQLGLHSEKVLSSGALAGNFSEWRTVDDRWAYTFIPDPFGDHEYVFVLVFTRRRSEGFVREAFDTFGKSLRVAEEVERTPTKVCWECGQQFSLWDIQTEPGLPARKAFAQRLDYWLDSYDGCGG